MTNTTVMDAEKPGLEKVIKSQRDREGCGGKRRERLPRIQFHFLRKTPPQSLTGRDRNPCSLTLGDQDPGRQHGCFTHFSCNKKCLRIWLFADLRPMIHPSASLRRHLGRGV